MVLDYELMGRLIQRDEESFAAMVMVLMIVLAQYLGSQPKHGQTMIDLHRLWSASTDCTKPCKKIHILNRITGEWGIGGMPDASRGRLSWGSAVPFIWQWGNFMKIIEEMELRLVGLPSPLWMTHPSEPFRMPKHTMSYVSKPQCGGMSFMGNAPRRNYRPSLTYYTGIFSSIRKQSIFREICII